MEWVWFATAALAIAAMFASDLWLRTAERVQNGVDPAAWDAAMSLLLVIAVAGLIFEALR